MKIVQFPSEARTDIVKMMRAAADRIEAGEEEYDYIHVIAEKPCGRMVQYGWGTGYDDVHKLVGFISTAALTHQHTYLAMASQDDVDD